MITVAAAVASLAIVVEASKTSISICGDGTQWCINGKVTNKGSQTEGLLINSRMIQGIYDDENATTVHMWDYPDSGIWDPERNTAEFAGNVSVWAGHGLNAFTVGMQGGGPIAKKFGDHQPFIVTAYNQDGSLKPAWQARVSRVLQAADEAGMGVIVQCFYHAQTRRLGGDGPVQRAINETVDLILRGGWTNAVLEVLNEVNEGASGNPPYLQPDVIQTAIAQAQARGNGRLLVSSSWAGKAGPTDACVQQEDFILVHCNGFDPSYIGEFMAKLRALPAYVSKPKPIVFNECSTDLDVFRQAIQHGAGWGYYDQGQSDYMDGYQSPPTSWRADGTADKDAFFALVRNVTTAGELRAAA